VTPSVDHSADLTERILRRLRTRFYAGEDKLFFQEIRLLKQAISHPAAWLHQRGVSLPTERYEALLLTVLRGIVEHAQAADIRSFGRYFLHAVQQHMRHQGESYYNEGKALRRVVEDVMHGLRKPIAGAGQDRTVETLAAAHAVLASKGGAKKKAARRTEQQQQLGLFS